MSGTHTHHKSRGVRIGEFLSHIMALFYIFGALVIGFASIFVVSHSIFLALLVTLGTLHNETLVYWNTVREGVHILFMQGLFYYAYYSVLLREVLAGIDLKRKQTDGAAEEKRNQLQPHVVSKELKTFFFSRLKEKKGPKYKKNAYYKEALAYTWIMGGVLIPVLVVNGILFSFFMYWHMQVALQILFNITLLSTPLMGFMLFAVLVAGLAYMFVMFKVLTGDILLQLVTFWRLLVTFVWPEDASQRDGLHWLKVFLSMVFVLGLLVIIWVATLAAGETSAKAIFSFGSHFLNSMQVYFSYAHFKKVCSRLILIFNFPLESLFALATSVKSLNFIKEKLFWRAGKTLRQRLKEHWGAFKKSAEGKPWYHLVLKSLLYLFAWICVLFLFVFDILGEGAPSGESINERFFPLFNKVLDKLETFFSKGLSWIMTLADAIVEILKDFPFIFVPEEDSHHDEAPHDHNFLVKLAGRFYQHMVPDVEKEVVIEANQQNINSGAVMKVLENSVLEEEECVMNDSVTDSIINAFTDQT